MYNESDGRENKRVNGWMAGSMDGRKKKGRDRKRKRGKEGKEGKKKRKTRGQKRAE